MSKRLLGNDSNPKPVQADIPANTQKDNTKELVEMAAEQLADLLWKQGLPKKFFSCRIAKIKPK